MASYIELRNLFNDSTLRNKVAVAVTIAAQGIIASSGTETAPRIAWAQRALRSPEPEAQVALMYVLAENSALTVAQINAASDTALQTAVNEAVDGLAAGMVSGA